MFRRKMSTLAVATGLAIASLPAVGLAAGPGFPATATAVSSNIELASFFGLPFPYGYNWRRHPECMRWVKEQDFWGHVYWRRVWVCD